MTRRLAIIPARGGSKRILNKNIRLFYNKPILAYSIEAAIISRLFDVIHISTDSDEIAKVAADCGHPIAFHRPPELADDHTPLMPVLKNTVEEFEGKGENFDQVMLIMACAPLIRSEDLRGAADLFENVPENKAVIAICKCPAPIARTYHKNLDNSLVPEFPDKMKERSQDLPESFYDAGQFYLFPTDMIKNSNGAGDFKDFVGYELPSHRAVDIDTEEDWLLAKKLYRI